MPHQGLQLQTLLLKNGKVPRSLTNPTAYTENSFSVPPWGTLEQSTFEVLFFEVYLFDVSILIRVKWFEESLLLRTSTTKSKN